MKKILLLAAAACLFGTGAVAQETKATTKNDTVKFTVIKENPITSIKDQNQSGTCWAFSSLAFFESELLRMGKGTHDLCESFVVYHTMIDRARASVRLHGDISFSQGGSFYDVVYCMKNYGMVPQEAMAAPGSLYGDTLFNHNELDAVAGAYVRAIAKGNFSKLSPCWINGLYGIYDSYVGELPKEFKKDGKTYTPKSYMESLGLNPDDYVSLTSFTHHPFYTKFIIEVQDNWRWAESYNLPLDEFMEVMESAVRNGYTFAWGADVSEKGFGRDGVARVPDTKADRDKTGSDAARWTGTNATNDKDGKKAQSGELTITQEMRQEAFDNWTTTDDHGMQIMGTAVDQAGNDYYKVKNSWGVRPPYDGYYYFSRPFVAYKTMSVMVNKKAIPAPIRKKMGL